MYLHIAHTHTHVIMRALSFSRYVCGDHDNTAFYAAITSAALISGPKTWSMQHAWTQWRCQRKQGKNTMLLLTLKVYHQHAPKSSYCCYLSVRLRNSAFGGWIHNNYLFSFVEFENLTCWYWIIMASQLRSYGKKYQI